MNKCVDRHQQNFIIDIFRVSFIANTDDLLSCSSRFDSNVLVVDNLSLVFTTTQVYIMPMSN